jgi:hypothetical protein
VQVGTESYKLKPLIKGSKKGSLAPPAEQTLGHDNFSRSRVLFFQSPARVSSFFRFRNGIPNNPEKNYIREILLKMASTNPDLFRLLFIFNVLKK